MKRPPRNPMAELRRTPPANSRKRGKSFAASPQQRLKVKDAPSVVSGEYGCDPMHIWPRSLGGCDDPLCVVPATRSEHRDFDLGQLDLLPHLVRQGCVEELLHALGHANGSLTRLLHRVTGVRWRPE